MILSINRNFNERTLLTFVLVGFWGLRLAIHIGVRHKGEDYRYVDMRKRWSEKGKCNYYFSAFIFIYSMQALFAAIINSSTLFISIWSPNGLNILDFIGTGVFIFGVVFELIGDR